MMNVYDSEFEKLVKSSEFKDYFEQSGDSGILLFMGERITKYEHKFIGTSKKHKIPKRIMSGQDILNDERRVKSFSDDTGTYFFEMDREVYEVVLMQEGIFHYINHNFRSTFLKVKKQDQCLVDKMRIYMNKEILCSSSRLMFKVKEDLTWSHKLEDSSFDNISKQSGLRKDLIVEHLEKVHNKLNIRTVNPKYTKRFVSLGIYGIEEEKEEDVLV